VTDDTFSPREIEVIELLLQGKGNKQIAAALGVSNRTVEFHLSNIYTKLGVSSRTEAVLKLSTSDLRESTGAPAPVELRESAVEKTGESADNGGVQIQLRRQIMKTLLRILFILFAGALVITLIVGAAAVLRSRGENTVTEEPATPTAGEIAATEALSYQALSPATIAKDGMLFEATGHLSCSELSFNLNGTFPAGFAEGFPNGEIPPIFVDSQLAATLDGQPLQLEPFGGGGGGGALGGFETLGQGMSFHVLTPLVEGQNVHLTATLTFNDYVGIPDPVPFELFLIVGNCATPTPFPYQYLDGGTIVTPGGVTVVVTPSLTQAEFMISVDASGPMTLLGPDPANSTILSFDDLRVEFPDQSLAFDMEPFAGGGSGPGEGETSRSARPSRSPFGSPLTRSTISPNRCPSPLT
jgi:DNA-binding CsgD family transcriptional regulator